jgi:tetratricopeptide (TPR) repeat protein
MDPAHHGPLTDTSARLSAALAGRYRLEREFGAGGMATVWLAYDLKHDRQVAVKVLHPHLAAVLGAERFLKEIRTTANLQHPHILPLFDSGDAEGLLFYVMPFVDGESLRQRITREKQLPVADAVRITSEVASALDYAHRQGVIHRDIKPENILLHDGRALVADFGIALAPSAGGSRLTETGMSMGTPPYMSPEQALGERQLDARSDIYAVGAMLYEMLTGAPPFTGPSAQAIVAKVITEKPVPPSRLRREIPVQVEDAVLTALQKDPADRFSTAAALQAALAGNVAVGRSRRRGLGREAMVAIGLTGVAMLGALAVRPWQRRPHVTVRHVPDTLAVMLVKKAEAWAIQREPSTCDSAIVQYSEATVRDSLYAQAYGGLAQARALCAIYGDGNPRTEFVAAKSAAEIAIRLDPTLAVAYNARGMFQLFSEQNFPAAQRDFINSVRLDSTRYEPWLYRTWAFLGTGELDSANASIRHAHFLDPTVPIVAIRLAMVLLYTGDSAGAQQAETEILRREPTNRLVHSEQLEIYDATHQCSKALKEARWLEGHPFLFFRALVAHTWASCGEAGRARHFADSVAKHGVNISAFSLAIVYAGLSDSTSVFQWLNQAVKNHEALLYLLPRYYAFQPYHRIPTFVDLLKRAHVK